MPMEGEVELIGLGGAIGDVAGLGPWLGQGVHFNMLNVDELDRVVEALGGPEKYARLGRVKAQYDPENLFRANYNITPVKTG